VEYKNDKSVKMADKQTLCRASEKFVKKIKKGVDICENRW